jgi:glycosyltransferase involved in cell wall biosynthesis
MADRSLNVVMVVPPYYDLPPAGYGGIEAVVADLVDGLITAGHTVTLVGPDCHNATMAEMVAVWPRAQTDRLLDPEIGIAHTMLTRRAVEHLIVEREVDVIHDHTFGGPLNAYAYAQLGVPTVVTTHNPVHTHNRRYYRSLGKDAGLISISRRQRSLAPDLNWLSTVYNGLNPAEWPFMSTKQDYAVFLGRYHPDKGAHLAVMAAHEAGLRILLAGKKVEPIEQQYYEDVVVPMLLPGDEAMDVADAQLKREMLLHARCMLFPVRWEEPFGMVVIEAMACGTPVVALDGGAVREVIDSGVSGFVCGHPSELADAVRRTIDLDPAACRRHVVERFDVSAMTQGYVDAYELATRKAVPAVTR